jgi:tetratricopeptide (TPR) repeat protein
MVIRVFLAALILVAAATHPSVPPPLAAQSPGVQPPRPALPATADVNNPRAYYDLGLDLIRSQPRAAADAFYWAYQLDPIAADALYGRYAALLLSDRERLLRYWQGERRTVRHPEMMAIDSLYWRALTIDPFLYRRFDADIFSAVVETHFRRSLRNVPGGLHVDEGTIFRWTHQFLNEGGPVVRGREAYSRRRFDDALRLYEEATRQSRNQSFLRAERARIMALTGRTAGALEEMQRALDELRRQDERDLVYLYESKSLLEHSLGVLHARLGATGPAREAFGRAIQEDLTFFPAQVELAALALAEGDTASAIAAMDLAVQAHPDQPALRYQYGELLLMLRRPGEAKEHLLHAISIAPAYAEPHYVLGVSHEMEGDIAGAVDAYRTFAGSARRSHPLRSTVEQRASRLEGFLATMLPDVEHR